MLALLRSDPPAQEVTPPADPGQLQPGDTLLGVMLAAPIGHGNAARVWSGLLGEDLVAVKVLDPALPGGEASRAAFARGAAAMARLASLRLRATLGSGDARARGEAAQLLARQGHRDLSGRDLSGADLSGAELASVAFRGASLARANLSGATLMEAEFDGADLTEAAAGGANLAGSNAQAAAGWATVACDEATNMPRGWRCAEGRPAWQEEE